MKDKPIPSIADMFSNFNKTVLVLFIVVTFLITALWAYFLHHTKIENWEAVVVERFENRFHNQLSTLVKETDHASKDPIVSAYISNDRVETNSLLLSRLITELSLVENKHDSLKSVSINDNSNKIIAQSYINSFDYQNLIQIKSRFFSSKLDEFMDGLYLNSNTGDLYLLIKRDLSGFSGNFNFSIRSFVSLEELISKATGTDGSPTFVFSDGQQYFSSKSAQKSPIEYGALNNEASINDTTPVFEYNNSSWLSYSIGEDSKVFVRLSRPSFGLELVLWVVMASLVMFIGAFLAYRKLKNDVRLKLDQAMHDVTSAALEDLTNPKTFRFQEGRLISSVYKKHLDKLNLQVRELQQLAHNDPLTGFLNSRSFLIQVDKLTNHKNSEFIFLSIDVNNFERISTAHGVSIANQMFVYLSEKLSDFLNHQKITNFDGMNKGFILGLLSPQRFGVVVNGNDSVIDEAFLSENIISLTKNSIRINNNELFVTTNIGTSFYPYDAQNCNELLQRANIALEKSKIVSEANYCIYSGEFQGDLLRVETLQQDMHRALKNNEFHLVYQPIFNDKNVTTGVEVLVRWNHPTFGVISPEDFIPIAEENGLIIDIGHWILLQACKQSLQWTNNGLRPLRISINVSCKQLFDRDFSSKVFNALDSYGISPGLISLEITETTAMNIDQTIQKNISTVKGRGVRVSMDDFGTGHSSLSRLVDMQVDTIKVDRSFITDIETNQTKFKVVKSICEMSKVLELNLICEGVENFTQFTMLKEIGCKSFQGYFYSKPLTGHKIENLIRSESNNVVSIDMRKH